METRMLAERLDNVAGSDALGAFRKELFSNDGAVLEHLFTMAAEPSTRGTGEAIQETIYPTEYAPESAPAAAEGAAKTAEETSGPTRSGVAISPTLPTAFETRNTGETLEAVVQPVTVGEGMWDASLTMEVVGLTGTSTHGAEELLIRMPVFVSSRIAGLLRLQEGRWRLLRTMEAPRGLDGKPTGRSWLAIVRIDRSE